jgi:hypothetical protein
MSITALNEWLTRDDGALVATFADELRQHIAELEREGGFFAYAVLSLEGASFKFQYLSAAFNRETDLPSEHANDVYYRLSPNEWANYGLDVYPKSARLVSEYNTEFESLHTKWKPPKKKRVFPDDFMLDDYQKAHIRQLHRSILKAMKLVRDEGAFGGRKSFAILWAPDSPDDVLFCSAKLLNSQETFDDFWTVFGEESTRMDCDPFE